MREGTHTVFGAGASALAASLLGCTLACTALAAIVNTVIHPLIDRLGHEKHWWQRHPRRHRATHSLLGATILSLAVAGLAYRALTIIVGPQGSIDPWLFYASSLVGGLSHLVLDALNPSGVYVCGRRLSLGVARYDNPWLNTALQALGLAMLMLAVARQG